MTEAAPPAEPLQKLPVFAVVSETYGDFFRYLRYLPQAILLPTLLSAPLYWVYLQNMKQMLVDPTGSSTQALLFIPINFGFFLISILFYVSWYRLCLLGPETGRPPLFPLPNRRHWRFLGYTLLMMAIYFAIAVFGSLVVAVGALVTGALTTVPGAQPELSVPAAVLLVLWGLFLFVLIIFMLLRLSFIFPAAAVDENYALRNSWAHTKGQALRLFAAMLMTCLPIYLLMIAISLVLTPSLFEPFDQQQLQDPAQAIELLESQLFTSLLFGLPLGLSIAALFVGTFAAAFKAVTGWYPEPEPASPAVPADSLGA